MSIIHLIYNKKEIKNKIKEYNTKINYSLDKLNELNRMPVCVWQFENKSRIIKIDFNEYGLFLREWQKIGNNAEIIKKEIYTK